MIDKKRFLIGSGIISVMIFVVGRSGLTYDYCPSVHVPCVDLIYDGLLILLPIIPLFLLTLVTYKMRDGVYRAWLYFSYLWIPLSMIAIFFAPEYTNDWMLPVEKGSVALVSSALFLIISLIIIIWKYIAGRKQN